MTKMRLFDDDYEIQFDSGSSYLSRMSDEEVMLAVKNYDRKTEKDLEYYKQVLKDGVISPFTVDALEVICDYECNTNVLEVVTDLLLYANKNVKDVEYLKQQLAPVSKYISFNGTDDLVNTIIKVASDIKYFKSEESYKKVNGEDASDGNAIYDDLAKDLTRFLDLPRDKVIYRLSHRTSVDLGELIQMYCELIYIYPTSDYEVKELNRVTKDCILAGIASLVTSSKCSGLAQCANNLYEIMTDRGMQRVAYSNSRACSFSQDAYNLVVQSTQYL